HPADQAVRGVHAAGADLLRAEPDSYRRRQARRDPHARHAHRDGLAAAPLGTLMIEFKNVSKWYGEYLALDDINDSVRQGEVLVVCGPSGSGKSTLIRTINRLEPIQKGSILVDGVDVYQCKSLDEMRSHIGFVFQQFNLFPHMSVRDNLMMAPVMLKRMSKGEAGETALALLERVGLAHKADAYPGELSGGQQQRVAIARALAMK